MYNETNQDKMKTTKTILKLVRAEFETPTLLKSGREYEGLCWVIEQLKYVAKLNHWEADLVTTLIHEEFARRETTSKLRAPFFTDANARTKGYVYLWKPFNKTARLNWLNRQIKKATK